MPRCFARAEKAISELSVRDDDVWISSFPKCGTTWTHEMVWIIVHSLDFKTAKNMSLEERVPFLELTALPEARHMENVKEEVAVTGFSTPLSKLTILQLSFYSHWRLINGFKGSFNIFFNAFVGDV